MALTRCEPRLLLMFFLAVTFAWGCSAESKKARHTERADKYYAEQKYKEAVIEYKNVLQIDPHDLHAAKQLATTYLSLGEPGQAFPYLARVKELDPNDVEMRLKLATLLTMGRKTEDARKEVRFVLEKNPDSFEAIKLYASLAASPEEVREALGMLDGIKGEQDHLAQYHLAVAGMHLKLNDTARAEEATRTALARNPNSVESHIFLGDLMMLKGDTRAAQMEYEEAADLAPLDSEAQIKLVDFYLGTRRPEEARKRLLEINEKAPHFMPAHYRLAEMAVVDHKYDDALKILDGVFSRNKSDANALFIRGRIHLALKEIDPAVQDFQEVIRIQPNSPDGYYQLALVYLQSDRWEEAKARLKDALRIQPDHVDSLLRLSELEIKNGSYSRAIESLVKLMETRPNHAQAYVLLGTAHMALGDTARATESFRKAQELSPRDPRPSYLTGLVYRKQGKLAEAEKQFDKALALSPAFAEPLVELVAMDLDAGKSNAALERVKRQVNLEPNAAELQHLLGTVHMVRKESQSAETAFMRAIELDPDLTKAYLGLGQLYILAGNYDQALKKLEEALKGNPSNLAALMLTGMLQQEQGNLMKAEEAFEQLLKMKPDFALAANNLAYIHSEHHGNLDKAMELAYKARSAAPEDPYVADTLGWILYKKGKIEQAVSSLQLSAEKLPDNPEVQYHLGMAYYKQGDRTAAKQALSKALQLSTGFPGADEARRVLGEL